MTPRRGNPLLEVKNIALIALVAVSALSLLYSPVRGLLTSSLYIITPRIWGIGDGTHGAWNSFVTNFRDKNTLASENDSLRSEISRMQILVLDRNLLEEKVNKLEESLGRPQGDNRVVAYVLAGPGMSPYDTLVVDAGADSGVVLGDAVVYAGSGVIGEIIEVSTSSSKVKLYSSPGEERIVAVGPHSIPAKAVGKGMGNFEAKVPQGSVVAVGDNVVAFNNGLLLGTVSFVEENPAEPFLRLLLRAPFNITEIRSVEIVVDKHI